MPSQMPDGPGLFEIANSDHGQGTRHITTMRRLAGTGRAPGTVLISAAAWLLAVIGAGALYVSFDAQRQYVFAVRQHQAAEHHRGAAAGPADDRVHPARARPVPRREILPHRTGAHPGVRGRVGVHERVRRRHRQPPLRRRLHPRPDCPGRRGRPGRRGDPPPRPGRRRTLRVGRARPRRGRRRAAAGLLALYTLRFTLAPPETASGLRRFILQAAPLPPVQARTGGPYVPAARTAPWPAVDRDAVIARLADEIRDAIDAEERWQPDYPALMQATGRRRSWCEKAVRDARTAVFNTPDSPDGSPS